MQLNVQCGGRVLLLGGVVVLEMWGGGRRLRGGMRRRSTACRFLERMRRREQKLWRRVQWVVSDRVWLDLLGRRRGHS